MTPNGSKILLVALATLAVLPRSLSFAAGRKPPPHAVKGAIIRSDGRRLSGHVFLTPGKRLRVWDPNRRARRDIRLSELARIQLRVTEERTEKEWRFKEEGSDEKIFTGQTYPRLDFDLLLTFKKRKRPLQCTFAMGMPIYIQTEDGKRTRFLIQPHIQKKIGQTFADLLYPKEIILDPPKKDSQAGKKADTKAKPPAAAEKGSDPEDKAGKKTEDETPDTPGN